MTRYTTELRFAVSMEPIPLYLLVFAEAGNVFDNMKNTDFLDLRRAAGVGARVMINPIGLIGVDMGYGFDRKAVMETNRPGCSIFNLAKDFNQTINY